MIINNQYTNLSILTTTIIIITTTTTTTTIDAS